jgi:hypothetical protein
MPLPALTCMITQPLPPESPGLSNNFCQLKLPDGSTDGRYKATFCTALWGDLWDYLQSRNNWSDATISAIDWTAFTQANSVSSLSHHCITLVKDYHGISPMGKIAHQSDPTHPAGCPSCACPLEDKDQVILCPFPIWRQWGALPLSSDFNSSLTPLP